MRRALLALPLGLLLALPAVAFGQVGLVACANEHDPAALPLPEAVAPGAVALGVDLALVQTLPAVPDEDGDAGAEFHACGGQLRPGAQLVINGSWLCTANWVYRDEAGALYLGTAGHCAVPGNSVVASGVPGGKIGDVVFSTGNGGVGNDFALIKIKPELYPLVNAAMCHWGGPNEPFREQDFQGADAYGVLHYGWGVLWGSASVTRPRMGAVSALEVGSASFTFEGTIAPGDSGSAIQTHPGRPLGVITHGFLLPGPVPIGAGIGLGTRVDHGLAMAGASTGHSYEVLLSGTPVSLVGL